MKMRIVFLSSAAILVSLSEGHAGDPVLVGEPAQAQYVRVCDAYGGGFFYLPGTETCLKIGGAVRTEGKWHDAYDVAGGAGTAWHTRAQLSLDTATDTEIGALKTNTVLRLDSIDGVETAKVLWANISLGGFLVGKLDSQYNLYMGYAGNVINDDVIYDGPYELNQLTYAYDPGNGFTAVASLEDSNSADDTLSYDGAWRKGKADHYAPNGVLGIGYKFDAWGFKVVGGYDSVVGEGAVKARVDADFGAFSAFLMGGWNTDGSKLNQYAASNLSESACPAGHGELCGWGEWAAWGGVTLPLGDVLTANMQLAYTDSKIFEATADVQFKPVRNLTITPELTYVNYSSIDQDQWSGVVRFQRGF
ncbi:porin [Rhizobium ruizarguesonis]